MFLTFFNIPLTKTDVKKRKQITLYKNWTWLANYLNIENIHNTSSCYSLWLSKMNFQFSLVTQLCLTLYDPMDYNMPGFPVHHELPELAQTHVHWVGDTIKPSHPLSSPSPPAFNLSQHQGLFKWVSSSHQVVKILEFQL